MPVDLSPASGRWRRASLDIAAEVAIAIPWLLFIWFNYAVASHRWAGWEFALSLGSSGMAAAAGWHLVRRAAARYDDGRLGDWLTQVEDAPPWALFPHPAQLLKREHAARCHRRWGVTPRTSGWKLFRRSWRTEVVRAVCCLGGVLHAWWLGV